jgi:hypothetical protein
MTVALEDPPVQLVSVTMRWAMDAKQVHAVARSLANTSFVPQAMRGKPDEITAAILTGMELGLEPMTSLRSIVVIQGTPALTAVALRGLVQAAGHSIWLEEATNTRATVCGQRRGDDRVQRSEWTTDRAKDLGLLSKSNWKQQAKAMLIARATSEVCRLVAADVLLGLPYSVEELSDDILPEPTEAAPRPKRTAQRKAKQGPVRTVPPEAPPEKLPEPELTAEPSAPLPESEVDTDE